MATASGDPGSGGVRRRLFSPRRDVHGMDPALESEIRAAHGAILDRFEQGLSEIEETARAIMRSAAEETRDGTRAELELQREELVRDLARDQTLRGLIAHTDERYQSIDVRVGRIEGNLGNVERAASTLTAMLGEAAESGVLPEEAQVAGLVERLEGSLDEVRQSTAALQERVDQGLTQVAAMVARLAEAPRRVASVDGGVVEVDIAPVAERLAAVQDYIAEVVEYLSARDHALVEWIQGIAEHTDGIITAESARVEEALSARLDLSVLEADGRIREAVTHQLEDVHSRLQEHAQTLGQAISVVEVKTLARLDDQDVLLAGQTEQIGTMVVRLEAVRQAAIDAAERVSVGLHERMADLTEQMRAESEDMRRRLVERAGEAGAEATRSIDERLGRLSELVQAALGWSVDEIDTRIHNEILRSVSVGMADFIAAMDRRFVDLGRQVDERLTFVAKGMDARTEAISKQIDERLETTDRALRAGLGALEESIVDRSTQVVDAQLSARFTGITGEIAQGVDAARRSVEETVVGNVALRADAIARLVDERGLTAARLIEERTAELAIQLAERSEATTRAIDERAEATTRAIDERALETTRLIEERAAETARIAEERAEATTRLIEERAVETSRLIEQRAETTSRLIEARTADVARRLEESFARSLGDRVAALAALIRSDNTAIADRLAVVEEQAAAKEAIRAIKELAAAMPQEISEAMDERLAVLGELFRRENKHTVDTVARAATALADRLDKTAIVIGERFGRDVEVVVDQIGSTMQTLASGLSRAGSRSVLPNPQ